jgi:O-antigen/teichoic acid export membrane protein
LSVKGENKRLQRTLQITAGLAGIPAAIMLVLFMFWGKDIMEIVYGEYYRSGNVILVILSAAQLFGVWAGSCGIVLNMTGHQGTMMRISVLMGLLTILGVWLVVAKYGSTGVASVSAATTILQNLLMLIAVKKKCGLWTFARFDFGFLLITAGALFRKSKHV